MTEDLCCNMWFVSYHFSYISVPDSRIISSFLLALLVRKGWVIGIPFVVPRDNQPSAFIDFLLCWVSSWQIGYNSVKL
jgi:hypothetical protein